MVDCPICGKTNDRGNRFCSGCGEKLPGTGIQCPMCGATNPAGSVVCRDCQARLVPMAPPADAGTDQEWGEAADRAYPYAPLSGDGGEGGAEGPDGVESVGSAADDWLDDLRASADEAVRPGHGERSEALDSGRIEDDFEPLEPVDIPDWLSSMGPIQEAHQPEPGMASDVPFRGADEWLPAEEVPPEQREVEERPFKGQLAEEPLLAAADIPEWLREYAPEEFDAQAEPAAVLEDDEFLDLPEFPDWLRDLGPVDGGGLGPPVEDLPKGDEALPDAAAGLQTRRLATVGDGVQGESWAPDYEGEPEWEAGPAWLREIAALPDREDTALELDGREGDEPISTAIRIPDWLKEELEPEVDAIASTAGPAEPVLAEEQVDATELETAEESLAVDGEDSGVLGPEAGSAIAVDSDELPSWLGDEGGRVEDVAVEPPIPATDYRPSAPAVPAWLAEILAEPAGVAGEGVPSPTETALEKEGLGVALERALIPEWLQNMRPGETEERAPVAGSMEMEGLLQGLFDLLPGSLVVRIPPSQKRESLAVPDRASLARAELLQSLLGQPASPPTPMRRVGEAGVRAAGGRRLVAMVLVVVVLGMLVAPLMFRGVPLLSPPVITAGSERLYEVVGELNAGDDVLVAFDYGAPEADELNVAARPVLQHVVDQGVHVSIVSTRPDGTLVASALMEEIAGSVDQYVVLNYRPGAAPAVSQLLTAVDRMPALLLVLTSRVAPLRRWVELTRVHYGDQLPIALVGSAALEPVASPYIDGNARQVSGDVHGLRGAASYEFLRGIRGDATRRLNALAVGHLVITVLMAVGIVYHGITRHQRGTA